MKLSTIQSFCFVALHCNSNDQAKSENIDKVYMGGRRTNIVQCISKRLRVNEIIDMAIGHKFDSVRRSCFHRLFDQVRDWEDCWHLSSSTLMKE